MPSWFGRFLSSSIGGKTTMALSGLALVGFLIVHLAGNLTLWSGGDEAFNAYAEKLESTGPLLTLAEVGLLLLFALHIGLALRLARENRAARDVPYRVRASAGRRTVASSTMLVSGLAVGVFLVIHLTDLRIPRLTGRIEDLAQAVRARLASPVGAGIYALGVVALGLHLSHAIPSALHTLGLAHPRWTPLVRGVAWTTAGLLALGFLTFPVLLFIEGPPS